jgi:AraC-like DNA-binding protein
MDQARKILIKGMVCQRCISTVKETLNKAGFETKNVQLGEVTLSSLLNRQEIKLLEEKLKPFGFSLVEDKREKISEQVKALLKEVYSGNFDFPVSFRFSDFLAEKLQMDHQKISTAFSESEKIALEKYQIEYRTEKVKEFLVYTNETLAAIAFKLNFSSVPHLSRQFKQQTGLTPSYFKNLRQQKQEVV